MLTYNDLKDHPREFLAATSLSVAGFEALLPQFQRTYQASYPDQLTLRGRVRQRRPGAGPKGRLAEPADKLLFILVYHKTQPLQTMHGLQFSLSQAQTNYWIHRLLPLLQQVLRSSVAAPERDGNQVSSSPLLAEEAAALAIDGSERRRQRPSDPSTQREHYSGKKKAHSDKNILLVDENSRLVIYLGATVSGKTHDKRAAAAAAISYPRQATLDKDSGFQGYEPSGVLRGAPYKKPRGGELSAAEQLINRVIASVRVVVEHVISGVKRCRIVKDVLRLTKPQISDMVMEIACGLHNLRQSTRHPRSTANHHALLPAL